MSGNEQVDPSSILRSIDDDQRRAQQALSPNVTLLYTVWGVAWLLGFLAVYATFIPDGDPLLPTAVGLSLGGVLLVTAIILSATHSARRSTGSRGPSVVQGAIYGNIYPVSFTLMGLLGWRLSSAGISNETMLSYWVAATCLIVGILFLAGAAMWNERSQLVFGIWIVAVGLLSIAIAPPHNLLAGAVGGLGFLVIAVVQSRSPRLTSGPIVRGTDD